MNIKESKQFCFKFLFLQCKTYFWVWTLALHGVAWDGGAKLRGEDVGLSLLTAVSICLSELETIGASFWLRMEDATAVQNTLPRLLWYDETVSQGKSANQRLRDGQPLVHIVGRIAFAFKKRLHAFLLLRDVSTFAFLPPRMEIIQWLDLMNSKSLENH